MGLFRVWIIFLSESFIHPLANVVKFLQLILLCRVPVVPRVSFCKWNQLPYHAFWILSFHFLTFVVYSAYGGQKHPSRLFPLASQDHRGL